MAFEQQSNVIYSGKRRAGARLTGDDVSMDEILASIRKIIDEEPTTAPPPTALSVEPSATRSPRATKSATLANDGPIAVIPRHRATAIHYHDDVLDELLAPVDAKTKRGAIPPVTPTAEAAVPMLEADADTALAGPAVASSTEAVTTTEPVAETAFVTPPETEIRTAADVLDALAAGLAASPRAHTPVVEPSAETPPYVAATAEYAEHLTPAAAAAAAVAEVIAANTAASGTINQTLDGTALPDIAGVATSIVAPAVVLGVTLEGTAECAVMNSPAPQIADAVPDPTFGSAVIVALPPTPAEPVAHISASFEDTVAGMLRPLLREWLDANMPRMVEKALQQEMMLASASPHHPIVPTASERP